MPDIQIYDFLSNLKGGGVRSNMFNVTMSFPLGAIATGTEMQTMTMLCKAASIPASTLGVMEIPFRGTTVKIPGDRSFSEWSVTILNDTDFQIRNAFERWSNLIKQHRSNKSAENPVDLMTKAVVEQLDRNGEVIKTYEFNGVWPAEVASIDLSWDSTDSLQEFAVTLQYLFWESDTTS